MVIQHHTEDGTALHPASFKLKYEFVDTRQNGDLLQIKDHPALCHRVFKKQDSGEINSPKNIFLYGRGGAKDLHCIFRIEAGPDQRIRLFLNNGSFGLNSGCETVTDPHSNRQSCEYMSGARVAELSVWEVPWRDTRMPRACFCDNTTLSVKPIVLISASKTLEIHFTVRDMNITEDYTMLHFHATFELFRKPDCPRKQRIIGHGGEVTFTNPPLEQDDILCAGLPWLIESRLNRSLFFLSWGAFLPLKPRSDETTRCPTSNRILLYSGKPPKLIRVLCPAEPGQRQLDVQLFSEDWWGEGMFHVQQKPANFLIEWIPNEPGIAAFSWLEISRSKSSLLQQLQVPINASVNETSYECFHRCPELDACISSMLWCDGKDHCPSGFDESETQCGTASRLLTSLPGAALAAAGAVACSLLLLICLTLQRIRLRRKRKMNKKKLFAGPRLLDSGYNS